MSDAETTVEVRLLDFPLLIQQQAAEHHDALVREFTLIRASTSAESLPDRLLTLIDQLQTRFRDFSASPRARIDAAREEGATTLDVTYDVPPEAASAAQELGALLDEADEYCRAGEHLVTLATPPLAVAFRKWFIDEFVRQLQGLDPTPWVTPVELLESSKVWPTHVKGAEATVSISGELDLASAPDLRDHLNQLHSSGIRSFELDSSGVSFIDSVGLSVILSLYRRCREEDGSVTVASPSPVMRRTLEVAGLIDVLDIVD